MELRELGIPDVASLPAWQRERRDHIVAVTLRMILDSDGNIEMRDIGNEADLSLSTLYRYFGSKEVLFSEAYVRWRRGNFHEVLSAAAGGTSDSDRIRRASLKFTEQYGSSRSMWDLSVASRNSFQPEIIALRKETDAWTYELFRSAMKDLSDKEADGIVQILVAVFVHAMSRWRRGDLTIDGVNDAVDSAIGLTLDVRHR